MTPTATKTAPDRVMRADARRNRKRVLSAARRCMARDGLEAGMEEIARCAKVGVGTVYRHFPTKEDLVEALAADRFERLAEIGAEALQRDDPGQAFGDFVRRSALIQSEDRALSEVLTSRPETMSRAAEAVDMLGLVAKVLGRAQAAGAIREDARPEDVPMLMCALAGTYRNPFTDPDRYVGIILDGLRAPGATPLSPRR